MLLDDLITGCCFGVRGHRGRREHAPARSRRGYAVHQKDFLLTACVREPRGSRPEYRCMSPACVHSRLHLDHGSPQIRARGGRGGSKPLRPRHGHGHDRGRPSQRARTTPTAHATQEHFSKMAYLAKPSSLTQTGCPGPHHSSSPPNSARGRLLLLWG